MDISCQLEGHLGEPLPSIPTNLTDLFHLILQFNNHGLSGTISNMASTPTHVLLPSAYLLLPSCEEQDEQVAEKGNDEYQYEEPGECKYHPGKSQPISEEAQEIHFAGYPSHIQSQSGQKYSPTKFQASSYFQHWETWFKISFREFVKTYSDGNDCLECFFSNEGMWNFDNEHKKESTCNMLSCSVYSELGSWEHKIDSKGQVTVVELFDPNNSTCPLLQPNISTKYVNSISLITAALNCQNYTAFEIIMNQLQTAYGYVDPSVLYDIIECDEYELYNKVTNNNAKLLSNPIQHTSESDSDEKYARITFFQSNDIVIPSNPVTNKSIISLLLTKYQYYSATESSHLAQVKTLLQFFVSQSMLLGQQVTSPPEKFTNTNTPQFLAKNYPHVRIFQTFMHPRSLSYLSNRFVAGIFHNYWSTANPKGVVEMEWDEYDWNEAISLFTHNEFCMAPYVAPIISKYQWFVDLLTTHTFTDALNAAMVIDNIAQTLQDMPFSSIYAILINLDISCIGKWFFLIMNICPSKLSAFNVEITRRNQFEFTHDQSFSSTTDLEILCVLTVNWIMYITPLYLTRDTSFPVITQSWINAYIQEEHLQQYPPSWGTFPLPEYVSAPVDLNTCSFNDADQIKATFTSLFLPHYLQCQQAVQNQKPNPPLLPLILQLNVLGRTVSYSALSLGVSPYGVNILCHPLTISETSGTTRTHALAFLLTQYILSDATKLAVSPDKITLDSFFHEQHVDLIAFDKTTQIAAKIDLINRLCCTVTQLPSCRLAFRKNISLLTFLFFSQICTEQYFCGGDASQALTHHFVGLLSFVQTFPTDELVFYKPREITPIGFTGHNIPDNDSTFENLWGVVDKVCVSKYIPGLKNELGFASAINSAVNASLMTLLPLVKELAPDVTKF